MASPKTGHIVNSTRQWITLMKVVISWNPLLEGNLIFPTSRSCATLRPTSYVGGGIGHARPTNSDNSGIMRLSGICLIYQWLRLYNRRQPVSLDDMSHAIYCGRIIYPGEFPQPVQLLILLNADRTYCGSRVLMIYPSQNTWIAWSAFRKPKPSL